MSVDGASCAGMEQRMRVTASEGLAFADPGYASLSVMTGLDPLLSGSLLADEPLAVHGPELRARCVPPSLSAPPPSCQDLILASSGPPPTRRSSSGARPNNGIAQDRGWLD